MLLYCCTTNKGKLREFLQAAQQSGFSDLRIEPLPELQDISAPEETGATFEENSNLKAVAYSLHTSELVLADDSGLEVDALGGAPGVRSARYAGEHSTDARNNALLLRQLERSDNRRARFVSVISLARSGQVIHAARGTVEGEILRQGRGENGFGYDPLFFCPALGKTLAEADTAEKFQVSHRGAALRALFRWMSQQGWELR
jgi:XTP/dITP diphosphohydrolase